MQFRYIFSIVTAILVATERACGCLGDAPPVRAVALQDPPVDTLALQATIKKITPK
jgi:hypothetical protein